MVIRSCKVSMYSPSRNSIEDCSDEENSTLRNPSIDAEFENIPKVVRRKAQFRGFYQSQKTLVVDSGSEQSFDRFEDNNTSSFDKLEEESLSDNLEESFSSKPETTSMENNIPEIVEDLVSKSEADDSAASDDKITEISELRMNQEDRNRIIMDLDNPGIQGTLKASDSLVNINHRFNEEGHATLEIDNNTSDEDISELGSENQSPMPAKRNLRISLKNLSDSEDEAGTSQSTQDSFLGPSKKIEEEEEMKTDESDVEVTDMDYYKIRHQEDKTPKTEYCLSFAPTKIVPVYNSAKKKASTINKAKAMSNMSFPNYPSIDIPDGYSYDAGASDDEEIPCKEKDFMSLDEFLEAHDTKFNLEEDKGLSKVCITANPPTDIVEDDNEKTESLRESLLGSSDSLDDIEYEDYSDDTNMSEIETSYCENCAKREMGEIILMEHDDLEGTIAVYSPRSNLEEIEKNVSMKSFRPELQELNDDVDYDEVISEALEEDLVDGDLEKYNTDEDEMSGADDEKSVNDPAEFPLPQANRKMLRISESIEGEIFATESELQDKPKEVEEDVPTDDEIIDGFEEKPKEECHVKFAPYVPPLNDNFRVQKRVKNKIRKRAVKKTEPTAIVDEI